MNKGATIKGVCVDCITGLPIPEWTDRIMLVLSKNSFNDWKKRIDIGCYSENMEAYCIEGTAVENECAPNKEEALDVIEPLTKYIPEFCFKFKDVGEVNGKRMGLLGLDEKYVSLCMTTDTLKMIRNESRLSKPESFDPGFFYDKIYHDGQERPFVLKRYGKTVDGLVKSGFSRKDAEERALMTHIEIVLPICEYFDNRNMVLRANLPLSIDLEKAKDYNVMILNEIKERIGCNHVCMQDDLPDMYEYYKNEGLKAFSRGKKANLLDLGKMMQIKYCSEYKGEHCDLLTGLPIREGETVNRIAVKASTENKTKQFLNPDEIYVNTDYTVMDEEERVETCESEEEHLEKIKERKDGIPSSCYEFEFWDDVYADCEGWMEFKDGYSMYHVTDSSLEKMTECMRKDKPETADRDTYYNAMHGDTSLTNREFYTKHYEGSWKGLVADGWAEDEAIEKCLDNHYSIILPIMFFLEDKSFADMVDTDKIRVDLKAERRHRLYIVNEINKLLEKQTVMNKP